MTTSPTLSERLRIWAQHHPTTVTPDLQAVRDAFVRTFPLERLPALTLEEYVIGHGDQDNFCYWLEQRTRNLGSIAGGAASKFGVFWSAKNDAYRFNEMFNSPEDAMKRILGGVVRAAGKLEQGDVAGTDSATSEAMGDNKYTMRLKALSLYFPERLLPIFNPEHLKHFLRALDQEPTGDQAALNVQLLESLRAQPEAGNYDTLGLMRFLYSEFPPAPYIEGTSNVRVWKVALGEAAAYLPDALEHGVILIGSSVEDLGAHDPAQMPDALAVSGQSAGFADSAVAFAHRMKAGDVVIANRGMSEVAAIGVVEGPYLSPENVQNPLTAQVLGDRFPYWAHARSVRWLVQRPLPLPQGLKKFAMSTITTLPLSTLTAILNGYALKFPDPETVASLQELGWTGSAPLPTPAVPADLAELLEIAELTRNIILYGPPGTGKTYTARRFADAFLRDQLRAPLAAEPTAPVQSPSYWWQAVALALADLGSANVPEIVAHPVIVAFKTGKNNAHVPQTIWQQLLSHTHPNDDSSNTASRTAPYVFTKSRDEEWLLTAAGEAFVAGMVGAPVSTPQLAADPLSRYLHLVTFHPAFSYEEFVEGLRPTADGRGLIVRDGVFKRVCEAARNDPDNRYVLLIDEINRADTARTFGELITLIEDDKRAEPGVPARYEVSLPYSDPPANRFSVPENVHIIGTMNTADRSIALMDIALRRRFTFVEVPPVTEHLGTVDGLSLGKLLNVLNALVTAELDRDHAIGHAYLTAEGALTVRDLRHRWRHKIVPLLQEYFYADEDRLQSLLGEELYRDATSIERLSEQAFLQALKALCEPG